jgi:hypothetical protein
MQSSGQGQVGRMKGKGNEQAVSFSSGGTYEIVE